MHNYFGWTMQVGEKKKQKQSTSQFKTLAEMDSLPIKWGLIDCFNFVNSIFSPGKN
jgi:hypothetical protein